MNELVFFTILSIAGIVLILFSYPLMPAVIFLLTISLVAFVGEDIVSGNGHYTYKRVGGFKNNVPLYIIPFWIFFITLSNFIALQAVLLSGYGALSFTGTILTAFLSGVICFSIDFLLIEPVMCRKMAYWRWHSKKTPLSKLNKRNGFTAPLGNYIVWFMFPLLSGLIFTLFSLS